MKRGQLGRCVRGLFTLKGLLILVVPPTLLFTWIYVMGVASAALVGGGVAARRLRAA